MHFSQTVGSPAERALCDYAPFNKDIWWRKLVLLQLVIHFINNANFNQPQIDFSFGVSIIPSAFQERRT